MSAVAAFAEPFAAAGYSLGPVPATAKQTWSYARAYAAPLDLPPGDWAATAKNAVNAAENTVERLQQTPSAKYVTFVERVDAAHAGHAAQKVITVHVTFVVQ